VALFASLDVHAQSSVTLYGVIDSSLLYQNKNGGDAFGGKTKSSTTMFAGSGGIWGSEFGMRGVEDLGGGTQIGFQIAGQFNIGSGESTGALFDKSNIFYQGPYGRVTVGQQLDPAYIALVVSDPRSARRAFSAAGEWNFLQGKSEDASGTTYETNAISYSYQGRGLIAGALYKFGGEAGSLAQGRTISAGVVYDSGSWMGSGSYLVKNDSTGQRDLRTWEIGTGYTLGSVKLKALYSDFSLPQGNSVVIVGNTPPAQVIQAGVGVNWQLSSAQQLTLAYYFVEDKMNTANATSKYVISDDYFISKRTMLYGYAGLTSAKKGANGLTNFTTAELTSAYPGSTTLTVGVGIQQSF
jgi:predicted porin